MSDTSAVTTANNGTSPHADIEAGKQYIQQTRGAVEANVTAINAAIAKSQTLQDVAQTKLTALQGEIDGIQKQIAAATTLHKELADLNSQIQAIKEGAESAKEDIEADLQAIAASKATFEGLKTETQTKAQELQNEQTALKDKVDAITQNHSAITMLYNDLLVSKKDTEGKVTKSCIKDSVEALYSTMKERAAAFEQKGQVVEAEFAALKKSLEAEIRSLLPGAGAAGLASAYFDSKGRYGFVPYKPQKDAGRVWSSVCRITHYISKGLTPLFHYTMFILPIIAIFDLFVGKFFFATPVDLTAANAEQTLLFRALIATPLAVLSYFGFSSIRLNRRMYEEYNHKQRVMEQYHSFKQEIESEEDEALKQKLLDNMLEVVRGKPSLVMAKYDGGVGSVIGAWLRGKIEPSPKEE